MQNRRLQAFNIDLDGYETNFYFIFFAVYWSIFEKTCKLPEVFNPSYCITVWYCREID